MLSSSSDSSKIYGHINGQRRREKKTTNDQYELYCNYIESHREILYKRMNDVTVQPLWDELTFLLNKLKGPGRDKRAWQRTFENWRNVTRFKCRKEGINDLTEDVDKLSANSKLKQLEIRALLLWNANYDYAKDPDARNSDNESSFDGNFSDTSKPVPFATVPIVTTTPIPKVSPTQYHQDPLDSYVKSEIEIINNYPAGNLVRDTFPDAQLHRNMGAQTQTDDTTLIDIGISIRNELKRVADAKVASLHEIKKQTEALNNMAEAIKLLANKNSVP